MGNGRQDAVGSNGPSSRQASGWKLSSDPPLAPLRSPLLIRTGEFVLSPKAAPSAIAVEGRADYRPSSEFKFTVLSPPPAEDRSRPH